MAVKSKDRIVRAGELNAKYLATFDEEEKRRRSLVIRDFGEPGGNRETMR